MDTTARDQEALMSLGLEPAELSCPSEVSSSDSEGRPRTCCREDIPESGSCANTVQGPEAIEMPSNQSFRAQKLLPGPEKLDHGVILQELKISSFADDQRKEPPSEHDSMSRVTAVGGDASSTFPVEPASKDAQGREESRARIRSLSFRTAVDGAGDPDESLYVEVKAEIKPGTADDLPTQLKRLWGGQPPEPDQGYEALQAMLGNRRKVDNILSSLPIAEVNDMGYERNTANVSAVQCLARKEISIRTIPCADCKVLLRS